MTSTDFNKGDKIVKKKEDWIYYQPGHKYNECKEYVVKYGTVIAKSKFGVLVNWDSGIIKQEWIQYKNFDKKLGYTFLGMTSNSYTIYTKC